MRILGDTLRFLSSNILLTKITDMALIFSRVLSSHNINIVGNQERTGTQQVYMYGKDRKYTKRNVSLEREISLKRKHTSLITGTKCSREKMSEPFRQRISRPLS
jgi:hypothetical protein